MDIIREIIANPILQLVGIICTIFGGIIGVLALIPKTRNIIFKKEVAVKNQVLKGSHNIQAGGNIQNSNMDNGKNDLHIESSKIGNQVIIGNNNKQAGGNINE
jgi:UPF0716 family protein affecting phage T7 exclusion